MDELKDLIKQVVPVGISPYGIHETEKLDDPDVTQAKLGLDIIMSAMNGKERSEKEWKQVFMEAGFKHYKIFPIFGFRSLIELYA